MRRQASAEPARGQRSTGQHTYRYRRTLGQQHAKYSMAPQLPKIIAFDLDATLWYPEVDCTWGPPYQHLGHGRVADRRGNQMELMGNSLPLLQELATNPVWKDTQVAYVSRTEMPEWAVEVLQLIIVTPGTSMFDLAQHKQIFPGRKTTHFKNIHEDTGIAFADMLFFDNELRNITDCKQLGITCIYTPDGMTEEAWQQGLTRHAAKLAAGVR